MAKETETEGAPEGAPSLLCPECKRPLPDDYDTMTEGELLASIHHGTLKMLARTLNDGSAGYQELAVARGLLRDNKKVVPAEEPLDENLPPNQRRNLPTREFPDYQHDE